MAKVSLSQLSRGLSRSSTARLTSSRLNSSSNSKCPSRLSEKAEASNWQAIRFNRMSPASSCVVLRGGLFLDTLEFWPCHCKMRSGGLPLRSFARNLFRAWVSETLFVLSIFEDISQLNMFSECQKPSKIYRNLERIIYI